jgi:hypothetical protein
MMAGNRLVAPADRVSPRRLLAPAEKLVDKSGFFHFVDESELDKIFSFRFGCAWIGERLDFKGLP